MEDRRALTLRTLFASGFAPRRRTGRRASDHELPVDFHDPRLLVPVIAILHAGTQGALAPLLAMVTNPDGSANNAAYFSHTTDQDGFWNRKLDYIFSNGQIVPGSGLVHQDEAHGGMATMPLSDHAPVSVELELP